MASQAVVEKKRARALAYYYAHKDDPEYRASMNERSKLYREGRRESLAAQSREYYQKHRAERLAYAKAHREGIRERRSEWSKEYYQKNREVIRAKSKEYRDANREKIAHTNRRRAYKISPEQYAAMFAQQNGACAICEQPEKAIYRGKVKGLSVDHCHDTGKVRGLLCGHCNRAIGLLKHDLRLLARASSYLGGAADN